MNVTDIFKIDKAISSHNRRNYCSAETVHYGNSKISIAEITFTHIIISCKTLRKAIYTRQRGNGGHHTCSYADGGEEFCRAIPVCSNKPVKHWIVLQTFQF